MSTTEKATESAIVEETEEVETLDQAKERAMRQIEFYLSDSNLPYDKFLWGIYDKNNEHWIPIKQLGSFNRMRQFQKHGDEWLVEALRASKVLQVDEKGENVRRTAPLVERPRESVEERSVYAKGFPDEYPALQVELERYFARFGAISAVRMRRKDDKTFKNSAFCEFSEVEGAQRFLNMGNGPREFKGRELLVMSKAAYIKMKCEEKGISPESQGGKGSGGAWSKHKFNAFRLMQKEGRTDTDPRPEPERVSKTHNILGQDLSIVPKTGGGWELKDENSLQYVPGAVAAFECEGEVRLGPIKGGIKAALDQAVYIVNPPGTNTGYAVFQRGITDGEFNLLQGTGDKIEGGLYTWKRVPEEEERRVEHQHVQDTIARRNDDQAPATGKGSRSNRGGKGGRGGRGGKGGRQNDRNKEKQAKKQEEVKEVERESGKAAAMMETDPSGGIKRKREAEPDGPEKGVRGGETTVIKRARVD